MKKEFAYPVIVLLVFATLISMVVLSLQKIGPSMNPPRPNVEIDSLQTVFMSIKSTEGNWLFSEQICSPGLMLNECNEFNWKPFKDYKFPIGKNSLSVFIAEDMSKERAVKLLGELKKFPIKSLFLSSPIDSSLSNARKADPSIMLSGTLNQFMKWSLFAHIGLSTVYNFKPDFIIIDKRVDEILNAKLKSEIARRNIPVFFLNPQEKNLSENEYMIIN